MRSADFVHDPLARGCSRYVVAARYELAPTHCPWWTELNGSALAEGALDAKVAAVGGAGRSLAQGTTAVSSPPHGGAADLPPFSWSAFPALRHDGMPDVWNFPWYDFANDFAREDVAWV